MGVALSSCAFNLSRERDVPLTPPPQAAFVMKQILAFYPNWGSTKNTI